MFDETNREREKGKGNSRSKSRQSVNKWLVFCKTEENSEQNKVKVSTYLDVELLMD
jgi:hypothetical protein